MEHSKTESVNNAVNRFRKYKFCCGTLVLAALHIIVEITDINCGLLSKHLFQRTQQHGGLNKPLGNDKFV